MPQGPIIPDAGWSASIGAKGTNLVTVYERLDKKRVVYLRFNTNERLQRESLGRMLPWSEGRDAVAVAQHACLKLAMEKSAELVGIRNAPPVAGEPTAPEPPAHPSAIGLRAGLVQVHEAVYRGAARNRQHAREQWARIDELCAVFGQDEPWNGIDPDVVTPFVEARAAHYVASLRANNGTARRGAGGLRQTEKALAYLFQASRYLASKNRTMMPFVPPPEWLDRVRTSWYAWVGNGVLKTAADTLRYSVQDRDALLIALDSPDVDPRIRVAVRMGSGAYRLGQVTRMQRSHIELRLEGTPYGRMTIVTSGKKQGGGYLLTERELAAWDLALRGYLKHFEQAYPGPGAAYPLFPAGVIGADGGIPVSAGAKSIDIKTMNELWHQLEEVARVKRMAGRAWYGLRRANADIVESAAIRVGFERGLPLEERSVLLATNHAHNDDRDMQWHYRARADRTVDLDNLLLREELERPQAEHVEQKLADRRNGVRKKRRNRHPNRHPESV